MEDKTSFARTLRRDQTPAERRFWTLLHAWREAGWHFRRQAPIGPYVVDFVCKKDKLVFEIDGDSHYAAAGVAHDVRRTACLERLGYRVVRFTNDDVLEASPELYDVLREIIGEPGV